MVSSMSITRSALVVRVVFLLGSAERAGEVLEEAPSSGGAFFARTGPFSAGTTPRASMQLADLWFFLLGVQAISAACSRRLSTPLPTCDATSSRKSGALGRTRRNLLCNKGKWTAISHSPSSEPAPHSLVPSGSLRRHFWSHRSCVGDTEAARRRGPSPLPPPARGAAAAAAPPVAGAATRATAAVQRPHGRPCD